MVRKNVEKKTINMAHIRKKYPGVQAVDSVDFTLESGVVHALVGENGAGKSTLMKILAGVVEKDEGEIEIDGEMVEIKEPADAKKLGINIIEQEFSLFSDLNIYQNIFLGQELMKRGGVLIDWAKIKRRTKEILDELGLRTDISKTVRFLPTSEQQIVEIAKATFFGAQFLIMDEPTSSIGDQEKEKLFVIIKKLKSNGVGIIYITHRIEEIFEIADRVTVMRDGKRIGSYDIEKITKEEIIRLMVGREVTDLFNRDHAKEPGEPVLEVKGLYKKGAFRDISFELREGEVVGLSGLMGAQRTEIVRCIFGLDRCDGGEIFFQGRPLRFNDVSKSIRAGIGFVPEDRKRDGIVHSMSVMHNLTLSSLPVINRFGWLISSHEREIADKQVSDLDIKIASPDQIATKLSGGNQQKVVLGRSLALIPKLLILDEPTRGIDVGAKQEFHKILDELAKSGIAILLISSEMPEILGASDRIIVLRQGRITAEYSHEEATPEKLLASALT